MTGLNMAVDRCVCFSITFAELKAYADHHGSGLDDLRGAFGCGRGCALCVPYIKAMLQTGQVRFDPTDPAPGQSEL